MDTTLHHSLRIVRAGIAALALSLGTAIPALTILSPPAYADLAGDKATVDAAKAAGTVGEQGDGYLGFVKGTADAATTAAVTAINAARANVYRQTAAKTGVSTDAAAQATGAQLLARVPPGQYYKPLGGNWTQK